MSQRRQDMIGQRPQSCAENLVKFGGVVSEIRQRTHRQTDKQTSNMARCVTFAVARIHVGNRRNFAYFPSGTQSMGDRDPKRLTRVRPNLVVIDQSWYDVGR